MDEHTKSHLKNWVDSHAPVHYTDREKLFDAMLAVYGQYEAAPDIAERRGWTGLFDFLMDSEHRPALRGYSSVTATGSTP